MRLGCRMYEVTITGEDREIAAPGGASVPKRDLVMGLHLMLEEGTLRLARGLPAHEALVKEMMNMKLRVSGTCMKVMRYRGREGARLSRTRAQIDVCVRRCYAIAATVVSLRRPRS